MNKSEKKKILQEILQSNFILRDMGNNPSFLIAVESKKLDEDTIESLVFKYVQKKHHKNWVDNKINVNFFKTVFKCTKGISYKKTIEEINELDIVSRAKMFVHLDFASRLITCGFNRDLVHNYLKEIKEVNFINPPTNAQINKFKKLYSEGRILSLFKEELDIKHQLKEICQLMSDVNNLFTENEIEEYRIFPKKPKNFEEIHDRLVSKIKEKKQFLGVKDFPLQPREDLLKLDGKIINCKGEELVVRIAKTKIDLVKFSQSSVFSNCVGTSSVYGERASKGLCTIVGIFTKDFKPKYCIETGLYSFNQARGVGNSSIPNDIYHSLEELLTVKPYLPEDFNEVRHSFIYGYKYDPTNKLLYISFKRGSIYCYSGVENEIYEEFARVNTKGAYLNSIIKRYPYEMCSR